MNNSDRLAISWMFGIYVSSVDGGSFFYRIFTMIVYTVMAYVIWLKLDGMKS